MRSAPLKKPAWTMKRPWQRRAVGFAIPILAEGGSRHPMDIFRDFAAANPIPMHCCAHLGLV